MKNPGTKPGFPLNKAAAMLALVIGAMAAVAGGQILLGKDAGYYVINWLPVYNYTVGMLTVLVSAGLLWTGHRFAWPISVATLALHALVMLLIQTVYGDVVASESTRAMIIRLAAWFVIVALLALQGRAPAHNRRGLPPAHPKEKPVSETRPSRYHPLLVSLHWLTVVLVIAAFLLGRYLSSLPNDAAKVPLLGVHMSLGLAIMLITIVRLLVRSRYPRPDWAATGSAALDAIGTFVHYALYAVILLLAVSGISLALQSGLLSIVFAGSGGALPADLFAFRARALHGLLTKALLALLGLHVGAVLFHAVARRENLLKRMWYGS